MGLGVLIVNESTRWLENGVIDKQTRVFNDR